MNLFSLSLLAIATTIYQIKLWGACLGWGEICSSQDNWYCPCMEQNLCIVHYQARTTLSSITYISISSDILGVDMVFKTQLYLLTSIL